MGEPTRTKLSARARLLGVAVEGAGIVSVASALTPALRSRLHLVQEALTPEVTRAAAGATALAGLILILLGSGIARRRVVAQRAAVAILSISTVTHLAKGLDWEEAALTASLALILILNRDAFTAGPGPSRRRTLLWAIPAVVALDLAYGMVGLLIRRNLVFPRPSFALALRHVASRLVGLPGPLTVRGGFGDWFSASLTVLGALSLAGCLLIALAPVAERRMARHEDRDDVRRLIERPDGDSLDPFALRRDKRYVFSADRRAAVAYRYVSGVGLASGDPVGEPEAFANVVTRFLQLCDARGWRPAVLGASCDRLDLYQSAGLRAMYLGDEAVIDTNVFTLEGRRMRNVRQAISHTHTVGLRTEIHREGDLDRRLRESLLAMAERWRGGAPERGFSMSLDGLLTAQDPECVVVVARDPDESPVALQRYVPCKAGRALSLDAMRRGRSAPNGVNERMIADVVAWARGRGIAEVSLNFAAFRSLIEPDAELTPAQVAEAWFIRRLNRFFQIESLRAFNSKFRPRWVPRYVIYQHPGDLGAIAVAALSAEAFLPLDRRRADAPPGEPSSRAGAI